MHQEMHEFKHGKLHSGSKSGPVVKDRAQAIAIAMSESGQSKKGHHMKDVKKDDSYKDNSNDKGYECAEHQAELIKQHGTSVHKQHEDTPHEKQGDGHEMGFPDHEAGADDMPGLGSGKAHSFPAHKGEAHGFGHSSGQKHGHHRHSGHPGGHRIGHKK